MATTTMEAPGNVFAAIPGLRQLMLLAGIAGAVAAGIGVFLWARGETYDALYTGLSDRDAAEVTEALAASAIPYKVDAASGAVRVPAGHVHDARLKLAAQGLPQSGGLGMDRLDEQPALGVSSFLENARYQHALESELARTVSSLRPVQNARVHLAIPKPSAFARDRVPPSASVLLELAAGRSLERGQVASIVHLVASSIPDLAPERVTVIDQQGRLLSEAEGEDGEAAARFEKARNVEQNYARRIEQLLLPLTGPGRVSAQVHADLDFTFTEEVRESYAPDPQKVRSEQLTEQTVRGPGQPQGVPGAASNQPAGAGGTQPPAAVAVNAAGANGAVGGPLNESRASTRNYELDKTISHTRQPSGRLKRVTVAVLVDHLPRANDKGELVPMPLPAEELGRIEALVKEAIGFDGARGDSVNVMNAAFATGEAAVEPEAVPLWEQPLALTVGRNALGGLVLLILIFSVLRPTLRSLTQLPRPAALPAVAGGTLRAEVAGELEDRATLSTARSGSGGGAPAVPFEDKLALAKTAVTQDPKRVAQVVRNWVGNDG